ncbi:MAG: ABC transporter permease subunit [Acidimicrobiia bacterium]
MTVFWRTLRSRKRSLLAWSLGLIGLIGVTVAAYPSIANQDGFNDFIDDYPEFVQEILGLGSGLSITEPAGYLNSQFFANMLPLLFIIFLVSFAVRETATDEKEGTLDLVAAHPIARGRLMLEKAAAQLVAGIGLAVLSILVFLVSTPLASMDIGIDALWGATASVFLVGFVFGSLAFGLGAATGKRGVALGLSSGLAVATYILWGLAPLIDGISSLEGLSPFFWALTGDPILNGVQAGNALLLVGVGLVFAAGGVLMFQRRDIGV